MTSIPIMLPLLAMSVLTMAIAGAVLVRRAIRGRAIGGHRVCRKCDYDLFNLPDDQAACPECGSDLRARGAVLIGHRQVHKQKLYIGVALLLMALIIGVDKGPAVFREVDWIRLKPVAWLARDARLGNPPAWTELARRAKAGGVSGERAQPLINLALVWQKDLTRTWVPAVGDFVEAARIAKLITNEQWTTYARQAPQLSLRWRAKVRKGEPLLGLIAIAEARIGTSEHLAMRIVDPIDTDDPLALPPPRDGGRQDDLIILGSDGVNSRGISLQLDPRALESAPLGKRTTTIKLTTDLLENWETPILEWTRDLPADWELVAKDEQTVEIVTDDSPEIRKQIENALLINRLEVPADLISSSGVYVSIKCQVGALPVPLAHEIYLRSGEREWKLATIATTGGSRVGDGEHFAGEQKFDAQRVDIIFRPSPKVAYDTISITRMWNGEIVVPDVAVNWSTTRPATRMAKQP
ncbi:MAG: hypothetical protein WBD40_09500 [Tepidisphaeraceae bacterium]